mmetsp:Transcript_37303/g.107777  ORF Transcript_37303/g.107777 Transcript_37303/m.107777 type:complete len:210 (-) Transcript_37303:411-1040(-)
MPWRPPWPACTNRGGCGPKRKAASTTERSKATRTRSSVPRSTPRRLRCPRRRAPLCSPEVPRETWTLSPTAMSTAARGRGIRCESCTRPTCHRRPRLLRPRGKRWQSCPLSVRCTRPTSQSARSCFGPRRRRWRSSSATKSMRTRSSGISSNTTRTSTRPRHRRTCCAGPSSSRTRSSAPPPSRPVGPRSRARNSCVPPASKGGRRCLC